MILKATLIAGACSIGAVTFAPALIAAHSNGQQLVKRSMQDEMSTARDLLEEGRYAEATEKCIWLWDHMLEEEPAMVGVRASFFVSDLRRLTAAFEPAKKAFVEKRDALDVAVQAGNPGYDALTDWFALNEAVHDSVRSERWVLSLAERENGPELFRLAGFHAEDILLENGHFDLYSRLFPDLVDDAREEIQNLQMFFKSIERHEDYRLALESTKPVFIERIAQRYLVCLKVNEPLHAEQIAEDFFQLFDDDESRLALIKIAVEHDAAVPEHLEWIDTMEDPSPIAKWMRGKIEDQLNERDADQESPAEAADAAQESPDP